MKKILVIILFFVVSKIDAQTYYDKIKALPNCDYQLENIDPITDGTIKYKRAILSPNSNLILLISKEKSQIMDLNSKEIIKTSDHHYDGQWVNDSLILFRRHNRFSLFNVYSNTNNGSIPVPHLEFVNDHILKANNGEKKWTIANIDGNENLVCYGYLFSNDFQKVVIYTNSGRDYIYNMNGDGFISMNEFGISSDWADDNIDLISFKGLDYGEHYTVESELYIHNTKEQSTCKLTNSEKILEKYPSWSKNKITYIDQKTKIVYIGVLKKIN